MYRIKLTKAHPTGSCNMRDAANKTITVTAAGWTEVDALSPGIEVWRKFLVIEEVTLKPGTEGAPKSKAEGPKTEDAPRERALKRRGK